MKITIRKEHRVFDPKNTHFKPASVKVRRKEGSFSTVSIPFLSGLDIFPMMGLVVPYILKLFKSR